MARSQLNHRVCAHAQTPAGRRACRAGHKAAAVALQARYVDLVGQRGLFVDEQDDEPGRHYATVQGVEASTYGDQEPLLVVWDEATCAEARVHLSQFEFVTSR